jgi:carbon monoxide dehydrogenase subunit G
MRLDHGFTVPVPVDDAWRVLLDLPRVAPCLPGAALREYDGDTFTGTVKVKVGPIGLEYNGTGRFVERDEAAHRAVIEASGRDVRSPGTARATVTATLAPDGTAGTRVEVATELTVTGRPAQFGRSILHDVGGRLVTQFADCLAETLRASTPPPAAAEPVDLVRLTAGTATVRRYAGYALLALVTLVVIRWVTRAARAGGSSPKRCGARSP